MSVYSVRLFAGAIPTSVAVLYTPPAGYTIVVRDIELWVPNAIGSLLYIGVEYSPGAIVPLIGSASITGDTVVRWEGRVVLAAADTIVGSAPSTGNGALISGYQLD